MFSHGAPLSPEQESRPGQARSIASQLTVLACDSPGMKPGITREAGSEPSEILYRQLFPAPGQPAPHLLPIDNMTTRGTFNLTKGQAFVNDLLLTGETAVTNLTGPQARRCDALALDGGPGGHPKVSCHVLPFHV